MECSVSWSVNARQDEYLLVSSDNACDISGNVFSCEKSVVDKPRN